MEYQGIIYCDFNPNDSTNSLNLYNHFLSYYLGASLFLLSLGEHHYFDLPGAFGPGSTTMIFNERDEKKKQLCASKEIKLVCIPYWYAYVHSNSTLLLLLLLFLLLFKSCFVRGLWTMPFFMIFSSFNFHSEYFIGGMDMKIHFALHCTRYCLNFSTKLTLHQYQIIFQLDTT